MSSEILWDFYSCVLESILTSCITVWYGSATVMLLPQMPAESGQDS